MEQAIPEKNVQEAPFPVELAGLVTKCVVDPGWQVFLDEGRRRGQGCAGLTLNFLVEVFDSYHPDRGRQYRVLHMFPVPAAAYDRANWQRWLFDRYIDVLRHEGMEMFQIDGQRPYAPHHYDGADPYVVHERGTDEQAQGRPGEKVDPT